MRTEETVPDDMDCVLPTLGFGGQIFVQRHAIMAPTVRDLTDDPCRRKMSKSVDDPCRTSVQSRDDTLPDYRPGSRICPDAVFFAQARSCQGDAVVSDVKKGLAQVILARHGRMLSMRRLQRMGGGALCVQTCQKDQVL